MHKCTYCERELKSNAGKVRHEKSCKMKELDTELNKMMDEQLDDVYNVESPEDEIHVDDVDDTIDELVENFGEIIYAGQDPSNKVVNLEVLGGEETYYDGHPRRLIKLKGLLSRTHDRKERIKVHNLILELM